MIWAATKTAVLSVALNSLLRGRDLLVFLLTALALVWPATPSRADTAQQIDRDALIFYLEDGLAASRFYEKESDLIAALSGADTWLGEAQYTNTGVGEALHHGRAVVERLDRELVELDKELAGFRREGPEFPPVFYWYDDWVDWRRASLDLLRLQTGHLRDMIRAVAGGDDEKVWAAQSAADIDRLAFQVYFDSITDQINETLPEGHPDRILNNAFGKWETYSALQVKRAEAQDDAAYRDATLEIAAELKRISAHIAGNAEALDAALVQHRAALAPFVQVLTRDEDRTEAALDRIMESYRQTADVVRGFAGVYGDTAKHELKVWRDGPTPELFAGYTEFQYRYEALNTRLNALWTERAEIMVGAIAR